MQPETQSLARSNRHRLALACPPHSLAIVHGNGRIRRSADGYHPHRPSSDLRYLTGIDDEDVAVMLAPDHPSANLREVLVVPRPDPRRARWDGEGKSADALARIASIAKVVYRDELSQVLPALMYESDAILVGLDLHPRSMPSPGEPSVRFFAMLKDAFPTHSYTRLEPLLHRLRAIKSAEEIAHMRRAQALTSVGFDAVARELTPGRNEHQLAASFRSAVEAQGGAVADYHPIVAGGVRACTLHYTNNDQPLADGELLLVDAGAAADGYNADVTRTFPIGGRFSARQREIYEACLGILRDATPLYRVGTTLGELELAVSKLVVDALCDLGLVAGGAGPEARREAIRRYAYHKTFHHLGLDVHDPLSERIPLEAGMVLTNEPGIYVLEEGLGVRLENDILVTEDGPEDLSAGIPIEAEAIEAWVSGGREGE